MKYSSYYMISCTKNKQTINYGFISWMNKIEDYFTQNYGLELLDLPDEAYMENYENGYSPEDMITIVIESNEFIFTNKQ